MILDELVGTSSCWFLQTVQRSLNVFFYGRGFPGGSVGKESTCNAGDLSSIPGLGRSPGEGHGNLFQYSCLENPLDRGAWQVTKGRTRLSS